MTSYFAKNSYATHSRTCNYNPYRPPMSMYTLTIFHKGMRTMLNIPIVGEKKVKSTLSLY